MYVKFIIWYHMKMSREYGGARNYKCSSRKDIKSKSPTTQYQLVKETMYVTLCSHIDLRRKIYREKCSLHLPLNIYSHSVIKRKFFLA